MRTSLSREGTLSGTTDRRNARWTFPPCVPSQCRVSSAFCPPSFLRNHQKGCKSRARNTQRLKAAVHYTVGCLCEEVTSDKEMQFSKQTIAAISELTFRQCENFAKDLEMFARHAKRSTINTEDVKLLARRSNSLLKYITEKNDEIAQFNLERKAKKKNKSEDVNKSSRETVEAEAADSED
uniref:Centromere protein S n=1 Tax=Urocitellus parryii TaxID=9999 RepID=A0A8D2GY70_UROPR|nr:centromere protein S isoform X1 [Urocitellus parryii]